MKAVRTTLTTGFLVVALWASGISALVITMTAAAGEDRATVINIPNARTPLPGILTGGQPTVAQVEQAKAAGYKTIVNLRTPQERGVWDEAAKAKELGMNYIAIPVAGGAGVTMENTKSLMKVLEDKSNYPVMIHCASGNRAGALFAYNAAAIENRSIEEALSIGRNAGLTSLEPVVRQILEQRGK
ncbi:hypothetical protein MNBD_GAMMA26-2295 [hydrothermal vent metagenome]|uniref:DSP-PTPase phosphatase fused to NAD+ Kinase domain-containing protein n=1 Tax=hydrothermal vent metagenome TaxID=652676 RepID=A0A3B1B4Q4_9ZZZZ